MYLYMHMDMEIINMVGGTVIFERLYVYIYRP